MKECEFFSTSIEDIIQAVVTTPLNREVMRAIQCYALGNPGVAIVLAQHATDLSTFEDVERLVGWPLSEHSFTRTQEIWDNLR